MALIMAMVDTCAGLSLRWLNYHLAIMEQYRELFHQFVYLKEVDNAD